MVHTSLETPYMVLFKDFLAKKHRLAVDAWGADEKDVRQAYQPLIDLILQEVPEKYRSLYPAPVWKFTDRIGRIARIILVSEFLVKEWADHFIGKTDQEIDAIAASFKFENCLKRDGLNAILTANAKLSQQWQSAPTYQYEKAPAVQNVNIFYGTKWYQTVAFLHPHGLF